MAAEHEGRPISRTTTGRRSLSRSALLRAIEYSEEEVDNLVHKLERATERQIATANSAVKGVAAERDLLSTAEDMRDLLLKAVKGEKEQLDRVFGGSCERIGRCRYCLERVTFSDMHASDQRWGHLRDCVETIEAVLKEIGSFRPWVPPSVKAPEKIIYRGVRRRVSPGRRVNWKVELDGGDAEFTVEPPLPAGLQLTSAGLIVGTLQPGAIFGEATYTVIAKNAAGEARTELSFCVASNPPNLLAYMTATGELKVGEVVLWEPSVEGGVPDCWSVSPELPAGLALDTITGVIRGAPSQTADLETYAVSASNSGGKVDAKLEFLVTAAKPTSIAYPLFAEQATVLPLGAFVEAVPEVVPGLTFSVDPMLPEGIVLDQATGVIRGTPTAEADMTAYKVQAGNRAGQVAVTFEFAVRLTPPESVEYPEVPSRLYVGYPVEFTPKVNGGVDEFSVSPELPAGLALIPTSGVISGTPSVLLEPGTWTVTARNSAGEVTCTVNLGIDVAPPSDLAFPALQEEFPLQLPVSIHPSVNGEVEEFSVSPALPAGLTLDARMGAINGTPTEIAARTTYEVTARNSSGETTAEVSFAVKVMPPTSLEYPGVDDEYIAGEEMIIEPQVMGISTSFTVNPKLPAGMVLNATTGVISGTPTEEVKGATYTITVSNEAGERTKDITFSVVLPPPTEISFPDCSGILAVDEPVTIEPHVEGGTVGSTFSVEPALPEGLSLNKQTGVISGSPVAVSDEHTYTVTVGNSSGSTSVEISIQVAETVNFEEVAQSIDKAFAEQIDLVTDIAEMLEEPSRVKQFGDWMIWMVHRAHLNDPELIDFSFNNLHMPPPHIEARIAPKLMQAMSTNTHIQTLSLNNSNLMKAQGHELAKAIAVNTTLRTLTVESNNLDSAAVREIAEAILSNGGSKLEQLRVAQQKQAGSFFGRPVEEAVGLMMEKNETIIKLGFECNDAHWRNIIDRALLRNNDYHRRRRFGRIATEDDQVVEEKTLSRIVLREAPADSVDEVFAEASDHSLVFRNFVARQKRLPTGSQLQSYARNEGTPIKYSTVAPLIKDCRTRVLDAARHTEVTVADAFEADSEGVLRRWSESNNNWTFEVRASDGKRFAYKSNKEPNFLVSEEWADWLRGS